MEWTRSETIGMASASCVFCRGLGLRKTEKRGEDRPCSCVFRAIFRACFNRYRLCRETGARLRPVSFEYSTGPRGGRFYGRKYEEFIADFEAISRRTLEAKEWQLLQLYFFQAADWQFCAEQLNLSRGNFFHTVYLIQEKLGRAFRETTPFALFPIDEYFSGMATRKVALLRVPARPPAGNPAAATPIEEEIAVPPSNLVVMPPRSERVARNFPLRSLRRPQDKAA